LDRELVAIDARFVDLLERKLRALLVLHAEIRARPRDRQERTNLDGLVLREGRTGDSACDYTNDGQGENSVVAHGPLRSSAKPEP